ncbi:MAG: PEP/pyruvate-binding domain-containing protein [Anaerolineae bacterium]|nr:PEP/pyruvate-binding domain-containing protein [Anaerolineae bacterium]
MTTMIRALGDVSRADAPLVGTKAGALGELHRAGFNVPRGFILTTEAYKVFLEPVCAKILAKLTDSVIMDPAELEDMAEAIRAEIHALAFPDSLHSALEGALAGLTQDEKTSLIARTSTPSDDLATSFGSGVARAYLGLVGTEELERASAKCWGALWNSRSMYYRHRKKIGQTEVALAVLVQPMIRAESAGVMFTQNPMSGARNEIQINAIRGLGAPLMGARFRPDQFLVDKASVEITDRTVEEQTVQLVVGADGHLEEHGIASELTETPALTDTQVKTLAAQGNRIQELFGAPQDIEWAFVGGALYVLQARPMTVRTV